MQFVVRTMRRRKRIVLGDCPSNDAPSAEGVSSSPYSIPVRKDPGATPSTEKVPGPTPGPSWKYQCRAARS
jgi:hypothetical protein